MYLGFPPFKSLQQYQFLELDLKSAIDQHLQFLLQCPLGSSEFDPNYGCYIASQKFVSPQSSKDVSGWEKRFLEETKRSLDYSIATYESRFTKFTIELEYHSREESSSLKPILNHYVHVTIKAELVNKQAYTFSELVPISYKSVR